MTDPIREAFEQDTTPGDSRESAFVAGWHAGRADLLAEQAKLPSARVTKADFEVLEGMLRNLERTNETLNKVHAELLSPPQPAITDEEIMKLADENDVAFVHADGRTLCCWVEGWDIRKHVLKFARALLERKP